MNNKSWVKSAVGWIFRGIYDAAYGFRGKDLDLRIPKQTFIYIRLECPIKMSTKKITTYYILSKKGHVFFLNSNRPVLYMMASMK